MYESECGACHIMGMEQCGPVVSLPQPVSLPDKFVSLRPRQTETQLFSLLTGQSPSS